MNSKIVKEKQILDGNNKNSILFLKKRTEIKLKSKIIKNP